MDAKSRYKAIIGASGFLGVGAIAGLVIGLSGTGGAEPSGPAPVTVQSTETLPAVTVEAPVPTVTAEPATSTVTVEASAPIVVVVTQALETPTPITPATQPAPRDSRLPVPPTGPPPANLPRPLPTPITVGPDETFGSADN